MQRLARLLEPAGLIVITAVSLGVHRGPVRAREMNPHERLELRRDLEDLLVDSAGGDRVAPEPLSLAARILERGDAERLREAAHELAGVLRLAELGLDLEIAAIGHIAPDRFPDPHCV